MGEGVSLASNGGVSVASTGIITVVVGGRVRVSGNSEIDFPDSEENIEHAVKSTVKRNRIKRKAKYLRILWVAEE